MKVNEHFDHIAHNYDFYKKKNGFYYANLKKLLKSLVPKGKNVLEIGCGTGDLLSGLRPSKGYGIDISKEMIRLAKQKHKLKNLEYSTKNILDFKNKKLDYIFMCDVIEHLERPKRMFADISRIMNENTIFVCTMANPLWEPILVVAEFLRLKMPEGTHYRWSFSEIENKLLPRDLKVIKHGYRLLVPIQVPYLTKLFNKYFEKIFQRYAFIEYFVAHKR